MNQVKLSDVLMLAFELVLSRYGDVSTEDGSFATCGIGEIIRLDEAMAHYFEVGSDDLNLYNVDLVLRKAKMLDESQALIAKQAEQVKMLREAVILARPYLFIYSVEDSKAEQALEKTKDYA